MENIHDKVMGLISLIYCIAIASSQQVQIESQIFRSAPSTWDRSCPKPSEETCRENPFSLFPHPDSRFFYQCNINGLALLTQCPCDHVFDMRQQSCVFPDQLLTVNCVPSTNTLPDPCFPFDWDRNCPVPSPTHCRQNPGIRFPHPDYRFFYICGNTGDFVLGRCSCDLIFDMSRQTCVRTDNLRSPNCIPNSNSNPDPCFPSDGFPTNPPDPITRGY